MCKKTSIYNIFLKLRGDSNVFIVKSNITDYKQFIVQQPFYLGSNNQHQCPILTSLLSVKELCLNKIYYSTVDKLWNHTDTCRKTHPDSQVTDLFNSNGQIVEKTSAFTKQESLADLLRLNYFSINEWSALSLIIMCSLQTSGNNSLIQRSFSDSIMQRDWCLNPYFVPLQSMYQPYCLKPERTLVVEPMKKKRKTSVKAPKKALSVGDVSEATANYCANVHQEQERLRDFRQWEKTKRGRRPDESHEKGVIFTLMSYNVLAQILLVEHSYLYRCHDSRGLYWAHRKWALLQEFKKHDADILCLQEVEQTHIDWYFDKLNALGYKGIFKQRTAKRVDGCALWYKVNKFDLVEYSTVEYFQPDVDVLNRENVAIIARLKAKSDPDREVVVSTTHLLYNPKRHDVRLAQTQLLLAEVDRMAFNGIDDNNQPKYIPVIMTGDFNLQPHSPAYDLIVNGEFMYEGLTMRGLQQPDPFKQQNLMGPVLIPKTLRITDRCQYADIAARRKKDGPLMSRDVEIGLIKLDHSERNKNAVNFASPRDNLTEAKDLFSTGTLSHVFNFRSVYQHVTQDDSEATTQQGDWVTVDYIFYSVVYNESLRTKIEGNLKLLGKYKLPTTNQCKKLPTIPNLVFGSDHLALLAKFLLTDD